MAMRGYDPSRESSDGRSRALASSTPPPTPDVAPLQTAASAPAAVLPRPLPDDPAPSPAAAAAAAAAAPAPRLSQGGLASSRSSSARRALALEKVGRWRGAGLNQSILVLKPPGISS
jgi:hypothetical protein